MDAAVDDEVSKNSNDIVNDPTNDNRIKAAYGNAIEKEAVRFYNLYNPEDDVLEEDLNVYYSVVSLFTILNMNMI